MPPARTILNAMSQWGVRSGPLVLEDVFARLADARGRPIAIHSMPAAIQSATMWIATPTTDWLCVQAHLTPYHQAHVILHEIGHMVLGHHNPATDVDDPATIITQCGGGLVAAALHRSLDDSVRERDAEAFALATSPRAGAVPAAGQAPDAVAAIVSRFSSAMHGE